MGRLRNIIKYARLDKAGREKLTADMEQRLAIHARHLAHMRAEGYDVTALEDKLAVLNDKFAKLQHTAGV